jgi:ATP-dependent RNA helicase DeaD
MIKKQVLVKKRNSLIKMTIKNLILEKRKAFFKRDDNKKIDYRDKKKATGFTNNPKYFGKKTDETAKTDDDRRPSFNNKKKFKNRKRPKSFKFNKFKKS